MNNEQVNLNLRLLRLLLLLAIFAALVSIGFSLSQMVELVQAGYC